MDSVNFRAMHLWKHTSGTFEMNLFFYRGKTSKNEVCDVPPISHDDVIKWEYLQGYWPFVRGNHRWPVNSPHRGRWRRALMFSLICAWINAWVNNRAAGDLRSHRAHYDATVMISSSSLLTTWVQTNMHFIIQSITWADIDIEANAASPPRDHSGYRLSQWGTTLHCYVVSHWLIPYPEWAQPMRDNATL